MKWDLRLRFSIWFSSVKCKNASFGGNNEIQVKLQSNGIECPSVALLPMTSVNVLKACCCCTDQLTLPDDVCHAHHQNPSNKILYKCNILTKA